MAYRFPKNCWDKKCPHFHTRDLSIDDLVCTCDLLKIQCDACDEDWCFYLCPLPNDTRTPKRKEVVSDMPRYIDEKDVYSLFHQAGVERLHVAQIDELPRANVAPRSEVEKMIAEIKDATFHYYDADIDKIKKKYKEDGK